MKISKKDFKQLKKIYDFYGTETQVEKHIEESKELIHAIKNESTYNQLLEIADNYNTLIHMVLKVSEETAVSPKKLFQRVEYVRLQKIKRQYKRMKNKKVVHSDAYYTNNKNKYIYRVLDVQIINATNSNDGQQMVLYQDIQNLKKYVRESSEFLEKFTIKENDV